MIQSVARAFEILEYISTNGNLAKLNDIASVLGLNNTTVHNLLTTLKKMGYIEQDELSPKYRISPKISQLYIADKQIFDLKKELRPIVENICITSGETCYLAVQIGKYFRYELKSQPKRSLYTYLEIGKEFEMKRTAVGKIFMAYSHHLSNMILRNSKGDERARYEREFTSITTNGYAIDLEEYEKELNCVAVPYFHKNKLLAVIGVSGPAFRFGKDELERTGKLIKNMLDAK